MSATLGVEPTSVFVVFVIIGLALLLGGAELIVRGGGRVALALRVPVLVVGLTVVAFGTSMPEFAVSLNAALTESSGSDIALANVTGSNIANIFLVLGIAALIRPLNCDRSLLNREIPAILGLQIAVPVLFYLNQDLSRLDGLFLLLGGITYNVALLSSAFRGRDVDGDSVDAGGTFWGNVGLLSAGVVLLVVGAQLFVGGAMEGAAIIGLSPRVVGLTALALGTSAPEAATSAMSAWKGETELAVGNSLGSNILNISMVLGITVMIVPTTNMDPAAMRDLFVASGATVALALAVVLFQGIGRVMGLVFLAAYFGYAWTLV